MIPLHNLHFISNFFTFLSSKKGTPEQRIKEAARDTYLGRILHEDRAKEAELKLDEIFKEHPRSRKSNDDKLK